MEREVEPNLENIRKGLKKLDFSEERNKIFLAESFKKIQGLIQRKKHFNCYKQIQSQNFSEGITKYSQNCKCMEYDANQQSSKDIGCRFPLITSTSFYSQKFKGGRKCFPILARIDGQIYKQEKFVKTIYKISSFNISLESEPNSTILYTFTKNGVHPLMCDKRDRREAYEKQEVTFHESGVLCVIAVENFERIESEVLVMKIQTSQDAQNYKSNASNKMIRAGHAFAARLGESFSYERQASHHIYGFNIDSQSKKSQNSMKKH